MTGKPGKGGKAGRSGAPGKTRPAGPGRQPVQAVLRAGAIVSVSQVYPDGGVALLGPISLVGSVERIKGGADRLVKIPQPDGSEIRIVIGYE